MKCSCGERYAVHAFERGEDIGTELRCPNGCYDTVVNAVNSINFSISALRSPGSASLVWVTLSETVHGDVR